MFDWQVRDLGPARAQMLRPAGASWRRPAALGTGAGGGGTKHLFRLVHFSQNRVAHLLNQQAAFSWKRRETAERVSSSVVRQTQWNHAVHHESSSKVLPGRDIWLTRPDWASLAKRLLWGGDERWYPTQVFAPSSTHFPYMLPDQVTQVLWPLL